MRAIVRIEQTRAEFLTPGDVIHVPDDHEKDEWFILDQAVDHGVTWTLTFADSARALAVARNTLLDVQTIPPVGGTRQ